MREQSATNFGIAEFVAFSNSFEQLLPQVLGTPSPKTLNRYKPTTAFVCSITVGTGVLDCPKINDFNLYKTAILSPFCRDKNHYMDSRGRLSLQSRECEQSRLSLQSRKCEQRRRSLLPILGSQNLLLSLTVLSNCSRKFWGNREAVFCHLKLSTDTNRQQPLFAQSL